MLVSTEIVWVVEPLHEFFGPDPALEIEIAHQFILDLEKNSLIA
jgi:hypothetical protein